MRADFQRRFDIGELLKMAFGTLEGKKFRLMGEDVSLFLTRSSLNLMTFLSDRCEVLVELSV